MIYSLFGVLLDLAVLICLGVTIFYARKLSLSLNAFRQTRHEFDAVMRQLSKNIDEAYEAVRMLKHETKESAKDLQKILGDSRKMAHELEVLNHSSAALGDRLEQFTGAGAPAYPHRPPEDFAHPSREAAPERFRDEAAFDILDREFEGEAALDIEDEAEFLAEGLGSQAERDLMDALHRSRKISGRGGG